MSSPKEKAQDIFNKMLFCYQGHIDEYTAKQCALIAVDEIIKVTVGLNGWIDGFQYWEKVRQEIEKL